jgi:hypothetical protein
MAEEVVAVAVVLVRDVTESLLFLLLLLLLLPVVVVVVLALFVVDAAAACTTRPAGAEVLRIVVVVGVGDMDNKKKTRPTNKITVLFVHAVTTAVTHPRR